MIHRRSNQYVPPTAIPCGYGTVQSCIERPLESEIYKPARSNDRGTRRGWSIPVTYVRPAFEWRRWQELEVADDN